MGPCTPSRRGAMHTIAGRRACRGRSCAVGTPTDWARKEPLPWQSPGALLLLHQRPSQQHCTLTHRRHVPGPLAHTLGAAATTAGGAAAQRALLRTWVAAPPSHCLLPRCASATWRPRWLKAGRGGGAGAGRGPALGLLRGPRARRRGARGRRRRPPGRYCGPAAAPARSRAGIAGRVFPRPGLAPLRPDVAASCWGSCPPTWKAAALSRHPAPSRATPPMQPPPPLANGRPQPPAATATCSCGGCSGGSCGASASRCVFGTPKPPSWFAGTPAPPPSHSSCPARRQGRLCARSTYALSFTVSRALIFSEGPCAHARRRGTWWRTWLVQASTGPPPARRAAPPAVRLFRCRGAGRPAPYPSTESAMHPLSRAPFEKTPFESRRAHGGRGQLPAPWSRLALLVEGSTAQVRGGSMGGRPGSRSRRSRPPDVACVAPGRSRFGGPGLPLE